MRAALVAARHKRRAGRGDFSERREDVLAAGDFRPIALRTGQHKIVVHHVKAAHAIAIGEKFILGFTVVHEHHVGIAAPRHVERLPGAQRHHAHLYAGFFFKHRQQMFKQPRLFGGGGGGDGDEFILRAGTQAQQQAHLQK